MFYSVVVTNEMDQVTPQAQPSVLELKPTRLTSCLHSMFTQGRRQLCSGFSSSRTHSALATVLNLMSCNSRNKRMQSHLMPFEASFWSRQMSHVLISHCPEEVTGLSSTKGGKEIAILLCFPREENGIDVTVPTTPIIMTCTFCFLHFF